MSITKRAKRAKNFWVTNKKPLSKLVHFFSPNLLLRRGHFRGGGRAHLPSTGWPPLIYIYIYIYISGADIASRRIGHCPPLSCLRLSKRLGEKKMTTSSLKVGILIWMLKLLITVTTFHLISISKTFIVSYYIKEFLDVENGPAKPTHTHKWTQLHIHKPFSLEHSDRTSWCIGWYDPSWHTHTYIQKQTHTHT